MSVNNTGKHSSATILIETRQITSNLEKANGLPGLRCFISTAWDLLHDRPINQRLSYDGTLANATIRSPEILSKSSTDSTSCSSRYHLKRWYEYHGVRHEVCRLHNGGVWLRPIGIRTLAANLAKRDAPLSKQQRERQAWASTEVHALPVQAQFLHKPRVSFAQQPSEIQRLVGYYFTSMYCVASATKSELTRRMQAEIQAINFDRPCDQQLKIPSLKTLSWLMDEYYFFALSNGRSDKRSIIKLFAGGNSKLFDRQANQTGEQSPPDLEL